MIDLPSRSEMRRKVDESGKRKGYGRKGDHERVDDRE